MPTPDPSAKGFQKSVLTQPTLLKESKERYNKIKLILRFIFGRIIFGTKNYKVSQFLAAGLWK